MDEKTLLALKGSIAKWEAIVDGTGEDYGPQNCPLCQLFHIDFRHDGLAECDGCPVAMKVGRSGCAGTPYEEWDRSGSHDDAKAELEFLKSLLPA